MNFKILASLLTIGVASAAVGYGTFAAFSDTETSENNVFSAGTLTLTLGGASDVTAFIGNAAGGVFAPGDQLSGSILLTNTGTIQDGAGRTVQLTLSATNTNAAMAPFLEIVEIKYGGETLAVANTNGNGFADLADLAASSLTLSDPKTEGKTLELKVRLHGTAGNDLQGASNRLGLTFVLEQVVPA